jgi:hypothetical protein
VSDLALPKSRYTIRVQRTAVRLVIEDGLPYRAASWHLWRDHRVFVPWPTVQNWVEAAGKKSLTGIDTEYLDRVLANSSGYLAIDELYDGPFCVRLMTTPNMSNAERLPRHPKNLEPVPVSMIILVSTLILGE